jgi:hypothetical protein
MPHLTVVGGQYDRRLPQSEQFRLRVIESSTNGTPLDGPGAAVYKRSVAAMDARKGFPEDRSTLERDDEAAMIAELRGQAQARVGTVLREKYRIDGILGIGGMAVVYVATHRNRQSFAVKMLHPFLSTNPAIRERFLGEGYRANSVKHKGAVTVFDDDVAEDGAVFLVMELLDGESLDHVVQRQRGGPPVRATMLIGHQLLDVLVAAHAANVVHRDIKPANLFVTRDGTVKVLDFGIARLLEAAGGQLTRSGAVLGTPGFMAPEQARGLLDAIDGKTDVWAVGATLYSLVTGGYVHEGESQQLQLIQAATQPAPSLAARAPGAPRGLIEVVDRALAFDKADRWTAAAMRDALRAVYVGEFGEEPAAARLAELLGTPHGGGADGPTPRTRTLEPSGAPGGPSPRPATFETGSTRVEGPRPPTTGGARPPTTGAARPRRSRGWVGVAGVLLALLVGGAAWKRWSSGHGADDRRNPREAPNATVVAPGLAPAQPAAPSVPTTGANTGPPLPRDEHNPTAGGSAVRTGTVSAPRPQGPAAPGGRKNRKHAGASIAKQPGADTTPQAPANPLDMQLLP